MVKLPTTVGLGFVVRVLMFGTLLPTVSDQGLDVGPSIPF